MYWQSNRLSNILLPGVVDRIDRTTIETSEINRCGQYSSIQINIYQVRIFSFCVAIDCSQEIGADHSAVTIIRNNMGLAWIILGQYGKQKEYYEHPFIVCNPAKNLAGAKKGF